MPRGGKRPGAGRKPGTKEKRTIERLRDEALIREMVQARLGPMTDAQITASIGIKHLMFRDPKTGKFERVTDEEQMDKALEAEGEAYWIYTKDPSTQAFTELTNRAYGRAKESAKITLEAGPNLERIMRGIKRAGNGHG